MNKDIIFIQALRKLQKHVHVVIQINHLANYYRYVQRYPALEHKCDVIYVEEISNEAYRLLSKEFFTSRDIEQTLDMSNVSKCLDYCRQQVKTKLLSHFYSPKMLQYTVQEEFNLQVGEHIFPKQSQMNRFVFDFGNNFDAWDKGHR